MVPEVGSEAEPEPWPDELPDAKPAYRRNSSADAVEEDIAQDASFPCHAFQQLIQGFFGAPLWPAVWAQCSEESADAYLRKKPPKGKPFPRERQLKHLQRVQPAKLAFCGPDHVGVTSCL